MKVIIRNEEIAIVIPAYNEAGAIGNTVGELIGYGFKVVVVDDGSADETGKILTKMPVHYLRHPVNLGQGAALQTGLRYALQLPVSYFVTFDADGQHRPEDIPLLVQSLENRDLDIVFGSRFMGLKAKNLRLSRAIMLKAAIWVNYVFTGMRLTDAHNGFRAMNRAFLQKAVLQENKMAHATEIMAQTKMHGFRYGECPVEIRYTPYSIAKGQRNIDGWRILQSLILSKLFLK